jgi:hypothetical protein
VGVFSLDFKVLFANWCDVVFGHGMILL